MPKVCDLQGNHQTVKYYKHTKGTSLGPDVGKSCLRIESLQIGLSSLVTGQSELVMSDAHILTLLVAVSSSNVLLLKACLHIPIPSPTPSPSPSSLHCVNSDGPSDGQNGCGTDSARQIACHHWHNHKT